jgi:hypothetical protein
VASFIIRRCERFIQCRTPKGGFMNINQFTLVADKVLRIPAQRKAAKQVIFSGDTPYRAGIDNGCTPGSVYHSVKAVREHFDHCVAVVSAK